MLDWAMEYTRAVGVELADMLVSVNARVPDQYTFGSNGPHWFIQDHQDHITELEGQLSDLVTMTDCTVQDLQIMNQVYCQDL